MSNVNKNITLEEKLISPHTYKILKFIFIFLNKFSLVPCSLMKVRVHEPKHDAVTSGDIKKSCSDRGSLCSLLYIFITAGCPTQK